MTIVIKCYYTLKIHITPHSMFIWTLQTTHFKCSKLWMRWDNFCSVFDVVIVINIIMLSFEVLFFYIPFNLISRWFYHSLNATVLHRNDFVQWKWKFFFSAYLEQTEREKLGKSAGARRGKEEIGKDRERERTIFPDYLSIIFQ